MLRFKTRDDTPSHGKAWVFLCALPEAAADRFSAVCEDIFRFCNCAVWYDDGADTVSEDLEAAIAQSAMAVLPVTADLLDPGSDIRRRLLPLLRTNRVHLLPMQEDPSLMAAFNAQFQNLQSLDKYSTDSTAIPYEDKLKRILDTVLLRDELSDRIREAFQMQLFVSYRKTDRAMVLDWMKQLHRDPRCRSVRVWYDEFLTPGEAFDRNIDQAICDSDLFLLALTKSMVSEDNYVIRVEYPHARGLGKEILPLAAEPFDPALARQRFPGLPEPVGPEEAVRYLADRPNLNGDRTPEQDFLLGLAFLHGLHVERHIAVGLEQLERSARRGYAPAALRLANIQILEHSPEAQRDHKLRWLREYAALASAEYRQHPGRETALQYADALDRTAGAECGTRPEEAFALYEQAIALLDAHGCLPEKAQITSNYGLKLADMGRSCDGLQMLKTAHRIFTTLFKTDPQWREAHAARLSYCYYNVGNAAARAGDLELARVACKVAIQHFTILAEEAPEEHTLVLAQAYGNLARINRRYWSATGDRSCCEQAELCHFRAIDILQQVIERAPKVYGPAFALEFNALAAFYLYKSDLPKAKAALDIALETLQRYEARYPGQYIGVLGSALGNRAKLLLELGDPAAARADYEASAALFRKSPELRMDLAKVLYSIGNTYTAEKNFPQARRYYDEAISIYESGAIQGTAYMPDYAGCCYNLSHMLWSGSDLPGAIFWAERAIEIYRSAQEGCADAYAFEIRELLEIVADLSRDL